MGVSGGGSVRITGAALILAGGAMAYLRYVGAARREVELLRDVIAALEQLAGEIRWKKLPLPDGIEALSEGRISAPYFAEVTRGVKSGITLQKAWRNTFSRYPGECGEILGHLELDGDSKRIVGALGQGAEALRSILGERRGSMAQRLRLCAAGIFSAAGVLVVILL